MSNQLEKLGYTKKTCKACGNDFWTIDERETCGDAPCDRYEFIDNPATSKKYDLYTIQDTFLNFFKKNDHTPIKRYPVLAKRWRDDVFLVGASIYNFQPWVTSGMVKPPANPLVVAQPSIRLNDVDNVGRTGRHMTCFTMGGHHAFNTAENCVYWENETVKYCHDFIKHIGINPEEITFIESWWEGGGNAGPCYEICVRGVELATLVFIKYRTTPHGLKDIPLKIVDTGYGLERFAWISQGTPTAYDASFGPVINQLKKMGNVQVDEHILAENARVAGMMDIEDIADLKILRRRVAEKLNISVEELKQATGPMESVYIIADHTRCLAFMLADGVIPSNIKDGYLARLILRRTIRFMKELGLEESLADIMEIQLEFLAKTYPEIKKHQDHINAIINLEDKRYYKTVTKGKKLVQKTIKHLKKENKDNIPLKTLIKLYDSHGIPPETINDISRQNNFNANVPDNFYTQVAAEHSEEIPEEKSLIELDFPSTELLFYDTPSETKFNAHVIGIYENNVILDQTLFYPEGGGQPSDIGYLEVHGEKIKVSHAEKIDDIVLHQVNEEDIQKVHPYKGQIVKGKVDPRRRQALTQNHTATHLIIAAARKILGDHIWQAGAQKGVKKSRIDISHYRRISSEELQKIEQLANKLVMDNISINTFWMDRTLAEKKYGFILYQGGVVPGMHIRTVEVEGADVQACAGTHCNKTGDVGLIKIIRTERIQDGVERIEFSAGEAAIEAVQTNDNILKESAGIFKVETEQLPKTCERFFTEWKSFKNDRKKLKNTIATIERENLEKNKLISKTIQEMFNDLKTIRNKSVHDANLSKIEFLKTYDKIKNHQKIINEILNFDSDYSQDIKETLKFYFHLEAFDKLVNDIKIGPTLEETEELIKQMNESITPPEELIKQIKENLPTLEETEELIKQMNESITPPEELIKQMNESITPPEELIKQIKDTEELIKQMNESISNLYVESKSIDKLDDAFEKIRNIEGIEDKFENINNLIVFRQNLNLDMAELIKIAIDLTKSSEADVVVIANPEGKIVGAASPHALSEGIKINEIIKEAAHIMGGGGGGKPHLAQGAGRDPEKLQEALDFVLNYLKN